MAVLKYMQVDKAKVAPSYTDDVGIFLPGPGQLRQVAFEFSGSTTMKDSQLIIQYDARGPESLPTFREVEQLVGLVGVDVGYVNVIKDDVNGAYGYSLVMGSQFQTGAVVRARNADSGKPMRVKCLVLYDA